MKNARTLLTHHDSGPGCCGKGFEAGLKYLLTSDEHEKQQKLLSVLIKREDMAGNQARQGRKKGKSSGILLGDIQM